jgi:CheY-like chemotaxis protein
MDWTLPDMTGLQCTEAIRQWEKAGSRHVSIVAMTGHVLEGDREKCQQAGMDDYFSKSFSDTEFRDVLHRWVAPHIEPEEFPFSPDFAGRQNQPARH